MKEKNKAFTWSYSSGQLTASKFIGYIFGIICIPFSVIAVMTVPPFGIILLLVNIFVIWFAHHCSNQLKRMKQLGIKTFSDYLVKAGFVQSMEIGKLKIDETNKRWAIETPGELRIHDFSEIRDVEIVQNGEVYKSSGGIFRSVVGGITFGLAGAVVGATTAKKSQTVSNLSVVIRLNNLQCPTEKIDFISSATKTDSTMFRMLYESAEKTASTLLTMKNM